MAVDLSIFLNKFRVNGKTTAVSHTSIDPKGSYYIGEEDSDRFMTLYCNNVVKKQKDPSSNIHLTITEKPEMYGPLRVDFDLKAPLDAGIKRQYTPLMIKKIISIYQNELREIIDPDYFEEKRLTCLLLEKKAPRKEDNMVKDGFHLHFPFFICDSWTQDEYLRDKVNQAMIEQGIWKKCNFLEPADKLIDTNIGKKVWLMYGSSKKAGAEPYLFTKCYDSEQKLITLAEAFEDDMQGKKSRPLYYLPRFLSVRGYQACTRLQSEIMDLKESIKRIKTKRVNVNTKRSKEDVLNDIGLIKSAGFMDMLSDDRADDYNQWMEVGYILFNIGQGCDDALELWTSFSKRSSKFVEGECEEIWAKLRMGDYTIGSLKYLAKQDSPDMYKEWSLTNIRNVLTNSLREPKPTEWDIAQVVFCKYRDIFKCWDVKGNGWYQFRDHRWREIDGSAELLEKLPTEVADEYRNLQRYYRERQASNDKEKEDFDKYVERCSKVITALKTDAFMTKVVKMCKILFRDGEFIKKLNENRKVWVFENCVIDLESNMPREGRPDDSNSYSCKQFYADLNDNDPAVIYLRKILKQIFPNEKIRKYFLYTLAKAMEGGNINKTLTIGTGSGDNGKTLLFSLIEFAFGEYCIKFPRELFVVSHTNSSSAPRPELARVRGRRLALVQEIAKTETLNIGTLKELTGNDSFFARTLHDKGTEIKPMFTTMIQCNEPPKVPGHDAATWDRMKLVDFESKFVLPKNLKKYPVSATEEEQMKQKRFIADPGLRDKFPVLAPALIWELINIRKEFDKVPFEEPEEVSSSTNKYREKNDVYRQFASDMLEVADSKVFLPLNDLFIEFQDWYSSNHSSYAKEKFSKLGVMQEFVKILETQCSVKGKNTKGWYGWAIKQEEVEDSKIQQAQKTNKKN